MPFKFEKLQVWQLALDYVDLIAELANQLPRSEEYNLKSQMQDTTLLRRAYGEAETLAAKLHTMRKTILPEQTWLREEPAIYTPTEGAVTIPE